MKQFIRKAYNVLKHDGFKVLLKRLINYAIVKIRRLLIQPDFGNWEDLKKKYDEKRIFIIGNGPSLNETELYLLKNEHTMCFNRVNLMLERLNWNPDFYVMTDDLLIKDMHSEVLQEILPNVDYAFFPDIHPSNVNFKKRIGKHDNVYYLNTDIPDFRSDLPKCGINKTVVNAGMQIAAYLGFSEIYLIGVDMTFGEQNVKKSNSREWKAEKDDDPNHFDPRYFGKGRSYHNPTVVEMIEQFEKGHAFFENLGVKVFNATKDGKLEVFKRVKYEKQFDISQEQKEEMFMKLVFPQNEYTSFSHAEKSITEINKVSEYNEQLNSFICPIELATVLISKTIFSHIPFGPFNNKYIFKKRKKPLQ